MNKRENESPAPLRSISLDKKNYPEIYDNDGKRLLPAEKAKYDFRSPEYPEIIDGGVFDEYLMIGEEVLWSCRGSASAKGNMAKLLPGAAVMMLLGQLIFFINLSEKAFAGVLLGMPFWGMGLCTIIKYIRGAYDSYFAMTNERIIFLSRKTLKTEYLYKIVKAEIYPSGKKTADLKLSMTDGDVTVIEGLDISCVKQIKLLVEEEAKRRRR